MINIEIFYYHDLYQLLCYGSLRIASEFLDNLKNECHFCIHIVLFPFQVHYIMLSYGINKCLTIVLQDFLEILNQMLQS